MKTKERPCAILGIPHLYPQAFWKKGAKAWYLKLGRGVAMPGYWIPRKELSEDNKALQESLFLAEIQG